MAVTHIELDKAELVDKLAQHRTDNADEADLLRMYYGIVYASLEEYTVEELAEMAEQEIDED